MKKITLVLLVLIFTNTAVCFSQNAWTKIDIQTNENLQKVIILGTKTLIFSNTNCYIGTNLNDWEKVDIPDSFNIYPIIFNGYIYINCKDGIYKSLNGKNWEKSSSLLALSLSANLKKMFAFTSNPYHIAFESNDGMNFSEISGVQSLYLAPNRDASLYNPNFTFSEAFGDTIYASGLSNLGPSEKNCKSFDNGNTWTTDDQSERISDMELDNHYGLISTAIDHGGSSYIVHGLNSELKLMGGSFLTLKYFDRVLYYGGRTDNNTKNGGIIMTKGNIGNIFYSPEPINRLESNQYYMIAVGYNGSVYVTKNDFTDYILSTGISSAIEEVDAEKINIFPNPAHSVINIIAVPGETIKIIDLKGRVLKTVLTVEERTWIDINDLDKNVYIVKSGNKIAKLIKQ